MSLKLVKLQNQHLEKVRNWRNSLPIKKNMYTQPNITPDHQRRWFKTISQDPSKRYWIIEVDGKEVGLVNLTNIDLQHQRCYWGIYLGDPSTQGKGIGKQCELTVLAYVFDTLKLNKLCCEVLDYNKKIVGIHQRFGFKVDGILRQHIHKEGHFYDVVTLSILKKEWLKIKKSFEIRPAQVED